MIVSEVEMGDVKLDSSPTLISNPSLRLPCQPDESFACLYCALFVAVFYAMEPVN